MTAIEHLRRLVAKDPTGDCDPGCPYCDRMYHPDFSNEPRTELSGHAPDCPWVEAKEWVEGEDKKSAGLPGLEDTGDSGERAEIEWRRKPRRGGR